MIKPETGWGITTGLAGHTQQVLGVLESLVEQPRMIEVSPSGLAKWLAPWVPPILPGELSTPWPDIVISAGRQSAPYAREIARQSGGQTFSAVLQNPKAPVHWFDFLWVNEHDTAQGPNVMKTLTAPHRVTTEKLQEGGGQLSGIIAPLPPPYLGLILGGPNSAYKFSTSEAFTLGAATAKLARSRGAAVLVTPSRRTGDERLNAVREGLGDLPCWIWDGVTENPYFGILGLADELVVTCDSVNMLGEAAVTGKPLHIAKLEGEGGKFSVFQNSLVEQGAARWLDEMHNPWEYQPLDSRSAIAEEILRLYDLKQRALDAHTQ